MIDLRRQENGCTHSESIQRNELTMFCSSVETMEKNKPFRIQTALQHMFLDAKCQNACVTLYKRLTHNPLITNRKPSCPISYFPQNSYQQIDALPRPFLPYRFLDTLPKKLHSNLISIHSTPPTDHPPALHCCYPAAAGSGSSWDQQHTLPAH